jgi:hypothetical protein
MNDGTVPNGGSDTSAQSKPGGRADRNEELTPWQQYTCELKNLRDRAQTGLDDNDYDNWVSTGWCLFADECARRQWQ